MSSSTEQLIKKKVHHEGVIKKSSNHILYEVVDITKTIPIKPQKKPVKKPKPSSRKLFDIYFFEEKEIGSINERKESIEKDQSLDKPIGKGNPFKRISLKENRTNTTNIQKRPRFRSYDNQKTYKQTQSKYSEKTSNPKKIMAKKVIKLGNILILKDLIEQSNILLIMQTIENWLKKVILKE